MVMMLDLDMGLEEGSVYLAVGALAVAMEGLVTGEMEEEHTSAATHWMQYHSSKQHRRSSFRRTTTTRTKISRGRATRHWWGGAGRCRTTSTRRPHLHHQRHRFCESHTGAASVRCVCDGVRRKGVCSVERDRAAEEVCRRYAQHGVR